MSQISLPSVRTHTPPRPPRARDGSPQTNSLIARRILLNRFSKKQIALADSLRTTPWQNSITIYERSIPVVKPEGEILIRVYTPIDNTPGKRFPVLVNLHGGAYCFGNLDTDELKCRNLCEKQRLVVINVDYRLAPEFPWPTGIEDSFASVKWVVQHADELRVDVSKGLYLCGLSAGANYVCILTQRALFDPVLRGKISGQVLQFPPVWNCGGGDHRTSSGPLTRFMKEALPSHETYKDDPVINKENIRMFQDAYNQGPHTDIACSPIFAKSFGGLPPAYIQIAGGDPLRDEGLMYAQRLEAEGVPVMTHVYPGVPHDFVSFLPHLKISQKCREDLNHGLEWLLQSGDVPCGDRFMKSLL